MCSTKSHLITGICGSPRVGNTHWMVSKVLEGAAERGVRTEFFCLAEKTIQMCDGCLTCEESGRCHLMDDAQTLYARLLASDGIILGSPTHFDAVTGLLKNFIDRLNPLCEELRGKKALVVAVGMLRGAEGRASRRRLIDYLEDVCGILGMQCVGVVEAVATTPLEVATDETTQRACLDAGQKLARAVTE